MHPTLRTIKSRVAAKVRAKQRIRAFKLLAPYEYVQELTLLRLHQYLGCKKEDLRSWVIVGGYLGHEVHEILNSFPNSNVDIYECSNRYFPRLQETFSSSRRVRTFNLAVTSKSGPAFFYETNLVGTGSLLPIGSLATTSYSMSQEETFMVECTTLDTQYLNKDIDVLWIDVQGAELEVLNGAHGVLQRVKAIFIEVSVLPDLYEGSVTFDLLQDKLKKYGFSCISLGLDLNLTGNSLFVRHQF
jgi:FkbM family methyltransferase